jgi:hypothetical protein
VSVLLDPGSTGYRGRIGEVNIHQRGWYKTGDFPILRMTYLMTGSITFFPASIHPIPMTEVGPEALADVAYGLFEHMLNKKLRERGLYLFELVEEGIDFIEIFTAIFSEFSGAYPEIAGALVRRFGDADAIYAMIREGEGVTPGKTTQMYWIIQDAPDTRPDAMEDELAGKWLIFLPPERVDEAWRLVRNATVAQELSISAKVSTAKENPDSRDDMKVIYVYTPDWRDEPDVMRVRARLKDLGFTDRIGYKRNIETFRGEYSKKGKRVTFYSA